MSPFSILSILGLGAVLAFRPRKKKRLQYDEFGAVTRVYTAEAFDYLNVDASVPAVLFLYTGETAQLDWITPLMMDMADAYPDVSFYQIPFSLGATIEQAPIPVPMVGMAGILGGAATPADVGKEYVSLLDTPELLIEKLDNVTAYARGGL